MVVEKATCSAWRHGACTKSCVEAYKRTLYQRIVHSHHSATQTVYAVPPKDTGAVVGADTTPALGSARTEQACHDPGLAAPTQLHWSLVVL